MDKKGYKDKYEDNEDIIEFDDDAEVKGEEKPALTEEKKPSLEDEIKSGASWFYTIAVLSVINSLITLFGQNIQFMFGLCASQIIDVIFSELEPFGKYIALVINVFIAGIYLLFGYFSNKKYMAAFIIGMIFYTLDGLLSLILGDYLGAGFHLFALIMIIKGFKAMMEFTRIQKIEEQKNIASTIGTYK
jgi:hypothetical protein